MVTLDVIRELFADLPGVEEGFSYGTRAFKVKKKLLARIHQKEDALVVKTDSMSVAVFRSLCSE